MIIEKQTTGFYITFNSNKELAQHIAALSQMLSKQLDDKQGFHGWAEMAAIHEDNLKHFPSTIVYQVVEE